MTAVDERGIAHRRLQGAGVTLHVATLGEGVPVILLHGFPENWRSWRHQMPALAAAGFAAWAPDMRGYNLSDRPGRRADYHLRRLVDDVAALVQSTGHSRAHVVGHDWGGIVAWSFAGAHPELLRRLVIVNAPHLRVFARKVRRPPQLFRSWYLALFQLPGLAEWLLAAGDFAAVRHMFGRLPAIRGAFPAEEIERYVDALRPRGALTAALRYYRALAREPDGASLAMRARSTAETLVIWGRRDPALGVELLKGLERQAARLTIHQIPTAGHWVQNEAPDEVNRVLLDFLSRDEPAG